MMRTPDTRRPRARRRGAVTIWTILCLPLLMTILFGVAEVGRLWHARTQLENAVEAAALAAVQEWAERGGLAKNLPSALEAGRAYAEANVVQGLPVRLGDRQSVRSVAWSFGSAAPRGAGYDFTANPDASSQFAVVLSASVRVARLCRPLFGATLGETTVTATTAAYYDANDTPPRPRLVRINADR